jgi:hypothetical protein
MNKKQAYTEAHKALDKIDDLLYRARRNHRLYIIRKTIKQWSKDFVHNCIVHPLMCFTTLKTANNIHDRNALWAFGLNKLDELKLESEIAPEVIYQYRWRDLNPNTVTYCQWCDWTTCNEEEYNNRLGLIIECDELGWYQVRTLIVSETHTAQRIKDFELVSLR